MVTHLERIGLIERHRSDDARVLRAYLTPERRGLVQICDHMMAAVEERMVSQLSEEERGQLLRRWTMPASRGKRGVAIGLCWLLTITIHCCPALESRRFHHRLV
jgi:hypothetical protein